jgi:Heterokaryon incompatibility protein (HET)
MSDNYKTTKSNEPNHKLSINVKSLPRTIAEAVRLCRDLDIYYLWVDALCILQDSDSLEWSEEASNMDKIYGFAAFTLAISSSADRRVFEQQI